MITAMKVLSIIVPIYNVENYISDCLQSILRQGLNSDEYEVILVNDGTKDGSMEKISTILSVNANFHVYEQSNQGLSAARNTGLNHAQGKYVLLLDSDDMLIDNSLKTLLQHDMMSMCDMVVANFVKLTSDAISSYHSPTCQVVNVEKISGYDFFMHHLNPKQCYVWRTLYRRDFLNQNCLRFIPGIYFEDIPFTIECYLHAKRCLKIDLPFYIYRQREGSIVASINIKKLKHLNLVIGRLLEIKESEHWPADIKQKIDDNIYATFSITIWYLTHNKELLSQKDEYINDFKYQKLNLPLNKKIKQRAISLMFRYIPKTYIRIRSLCD